MYSKGVHDILKGGQPRLNRSLNDMTKNACLISLLVITEYDTLLGVSTTGEQDCYSLLHQLDRADMSRIPILHTTVSIYKTGR